jgi:toxin ParE1/3/4
MRLIFAPLALADLEEIGDYIALDNPSRALSFIRELRAQCRKIVDNPLAFPAREDLAPGLRVLPQGQYLIFYRPMDTTVRVERILHGARDVGAQFTSE